MRYRTDEITHGNERVPLETYIEALEAQFKGLLEALEVDLSIQLKVTPNKDWEVTLLMNYKVVDSFICVSEKYVEKNIRCYYPAFLPAYHTAIQNWEGRPDANS